MDLSRLVLAGLGGWLAGMVVNYLADVLPRTRRITAPLCPECGQSPRIVNYLFWPRRCSTCGLARGWRTWAVELIFIVAGMWIVFQPPNGLNYLIWLVILAYFGVVAVIDLEHRLILHPVSIVGGILGFAVGAQLHGWLETVMGGVVGFGSMLLLYYLGNWIMGLLGRMRGRKLEEEALGFGDVNFGGVLGLLLGWPGILAGLVLTILLAGLGSLLYLVYMLAARRYHPELAIAYGPFLVASGIILLYF